MVSFSQKSSANKKRALSTVNETPKDKQSQSDLRAKKMLCGSECSLRCVIKGEPNGSLPAVSLVCHEASAEQDQERGKLSRADRLTLVFLEWRVQPRAMEVKGYGEDADASTTIHTHLS